MRIAFLHGGALLLTVGWSGLALGQGAPNYAVPVVPATVTTIPAPPQPTGITDIIKGRFPLAVTRQELGLGWRGFDFNGNWYYTRGDAHFLRGREYLVCYLMEDQELSELPPRDYVGAITGERNPHPTPADRFGLVLLDAGQLVNLFTDGNIQLESYKTPKGDGFVITDRPRAYYESLSLVYLGKLHAAVTAYSAAYLQTLPNLESAFSARQALASHAENEVIFTQPGTNSPYKVNALLSGRKKAHLKKSGRLVLFYEGEPARDGLRAVVLYNGTVKRVDAKTWAYLSQPERLQ